MVNYLLLIYPILLLIMTFSKAEIAKKGKYNENSWDREQTLNMQTFACFGIILHHLTQEITTYGQNYKGPITIFSSMGILFTSVFFFSSGFGLYTSIEKKPNYLDNFISHRLPIILIPFWTANIVNVLVRIFYLHIPTSTVNIIKTILGTILLNGNGWFIVEIFFLYLFFYVIFRLIKNYDIALVLMSLATILVIVFAFNNGRTDFYDIGDRWFKGEWWYNSTIVFVMGMIFARFKEKIMCFAKKHYSLVLISGFILLIVTFRIEEVVNSVYGYYREGPSIDVINSKLVTLIAQGIVCCVWTWFILVINLKVRIGNRLLKFLGGFTTEIFLIHGLFIKNIYEVTRMNYLLSYFLVIISALISAFILYQIDKPLVALVQSLGTRKSYLNDCEIDLIRINKEKKKKKLVNIVTIVICIVFLVVIAIKIFTTYVGSEHVFNGEIKQLENANIGDEIKFGKLEIDYTHPGKERLIWIVLDKRDKQVMLTTQKGIAGSVYDKQHREVSWKESDLHEFINDELYNSIFNDKEKSIIISNPENGDNMSLLSAEEASAYFKDDLARQLDITEVAAYEGTNINIKSKVNNWDLKGYRSSWWWLREEKATIASSIVTEDGEVKLDYKAVNKPNGAVRPVIYVDITNYD